MWYYLLNLMPLCRSKNMEPLTTPITLRPWKASDAKTLAHYANNANIARWLTDAFPHPYHLNDAEMYIKLFGHETPARVMAIEVNGKAVGSIGVFPQADVHRQNAEMGYWLAEPFWGKGVMSQAIAQMVDYAFKTFQVTRIFARPFGRNKASQRVLEKAGFTLEARFNQTLIKNGQPDDELVYAIRKQPETSIG